MIIKRKRNCAVFREDPIHRFEELWARNNPNAFQHAILPQQNKTRTAKVNIITFLSYSPPLFLRHYYLNMRINDLFHLQVGNVQGSLCLWHYLHISLHPYLDMGAGDQNSDSHAFMTSILPTGPSLQTRNVFSLRGKKIYVVVLTWYLLEFTGKILFIGLSWLI